ncbi:ribonuclease H-like domain-containing protein, partial [Tanacetum coccineum]
SVKPNVTQAVRSQADKNGQTSQKQGIGFKKVHKVKACFVCKSTGHLIKDCDFYDQKSLEPRVKNVLNTRKREVKPVWDYGKRANHQNFSENWKYPHAKRTFNPSAVLTRAGLINTDRSNVSTARSICTVRLVYTVRPVSTARTLTLKIAQTNSVIRPNHPRMDIGNPEILLQDHAVVDSGCSSHMTGNKAYLSDYEDLNGGFVAFGSDPKGGTQDSYVAGSSGKDKGPTQEYILLPLQPVKDVKPEDEQVWQDELEMMVTQELVANAMNDVTRQAFKEEKQRIASQKKAAQATSTNQLNIDRPFISTDRSFVSTDRSNTPNVSAASTNADESSFVYLGGKIPIDASTLPNVDLPIDPNMPDLDDTSDSLPNDGIFNGAYDSDEDVGAMADFKNMD